MHIPRTVISAALVVTALSFAAPARAQHRRGGGEGGHGGGGNRGESHASAAPRPAPPPAAAPAPRPDAGRPQNFNYGGNNAWRGSVQPRAVAPRYNGSGVYGGNYTNRGYYNNRNYYSYNNGYRNYGYRGYGYHGGYYHAPVHFYHPYYSFRPRYSIGFGLWVGYPVPYTYAYYDPFYYGAYAYPYGYPSTVYPAPYPDGYPPSTPYPSYPPSTYPPSSYPPSAPYPPDGTPQSVPDPNSIGVQPGQANTGGVSFDITPSNAELLVDGNYVGTVGQFTPSSQPLGLPAGRHQISVQADGYRPLSFEVNVIAGQVIPYQGNMERR
jgi:hypothetical protein